MNTLYRDNLLRSYRFQYPEFIPMEMSLDPIIRNYYQHDFIESLIASYPLFFPYSAEKTMKKVFDDPFLPFRKIGIDYTDSWGCVWRTAIDGMTGSVIEASLQDWSNFNEFSMPNSDEENGWMKIDWRQIEKTAAQDRASGKPVICSLRHGHTLMALEYIRGYENLVMDFFDENPMVNKLIQMVSDFNFELVKRFLQLDIDILCFPEDTGMQQGPLISPNMFMKYIIPVYKRYFKYTKQKNVIIHMHSDGDLTHHADQLIEAGIDVINSQDLVNGIDALAECFKSRVAFDIDVDRQKVTVFGTPGDIDDLIHEEVEKLGDVSGGLKFIFDLGDHIPERNVVAVAEAFKKYMYYYA